MLKLCSGHDSLSLRHAFFRVGRLVLVAGLTLPLTLSGQIPLHAANEVGNPRAEVDLSGRNSSGSVSGTTLARDVTVAHSGVASFKLVAPSKTGDVALNDSPNWVTSSPSTGCTASAWVKGPAGATAKIRFREYANGSNVGAKSTQLVLPDSGWQLISVTKAVAVGNSIDLAIYGYRFTSGQAFWVDDVSEDCSAVAAAPAAVLAVAPESGAAPLSVTADASGPTDADATPIATYTFDFGDGSSPVGPQAETSATHTYVADGTYTVMVTVADTGGLSSTASKTVVVNSTPGLNTAPMAALSVATGPGAETLAVTADASASVDSENNVLSYTFAFGGITVGPQPGPTASHSFLAAGTYTVSVTVTDEGGLEDTATRGVTVPAPPSDPVMVAAGDIACAPPATGSSCHSPNTAALIGQINPTQVIPLGDLQYGSTTTAADFQAGYGPFAGGAPASWGDYKAITHPTIGSHEYDGLTTAVGYFDYFNGVGAPSGPAGPPDKGYYSENLGNWHIVHVNSQRGYQAGSAQDLWLAADLAANADKCILATWHHPRFSSGVHGNQARVNGLFQTLYNGGADVLLSGNDHLYERFGLQDPNAVTDTVRGIRQFVVGTGGKGLYDWGTVQPSSEVRENTTYGVLKLTLHANSYDWQFVPEAGKTFTDTGTTACH